MIKPKILLLYAFGVVAVIIGVAIVVSLAAMWVMNSLHF